MIVSPPLLSFIQQPGPGFLVDIFGTGEVAIFDSGLAGHRRTCVIGSVMPDGSIYAGVSPDTGKPMYTTPKDAPLTCNFNDAAKYASSLDVHGRNDWRVPTKDELSVLFRNRAAIGGFNTAASLFAGWYWSSLRDNYLGGARVQRFRDGRQSDYCRYYPLALRCVRG